MRPAAIQGLPNMYLIPTHKLNYKPHTENSSNVI